MNWMLENKKAVAAGVLLVITFLSGWTVRSWYEDSLDQKIARVKDAVIVVVANKISDIKINTQVVTAKTVERIRTETVYRECAADQTMMELTNKARGF